MVGSGSRQASETAWPASALILLEPGRVKLSVFHGTDVRDDGVGGQWLEPPLVTTSVEFDHAANVEVDLVIR